MSVGPARFWKAVDTAPFDVAVRIIVASRSGEHFLLPYLCRQTPIGWTNALTGAPLALRPTHWGREAQPGERRSECSANTASTSSSGLNRSALSTPIGDRNCSRSLVSGSPRTTTIAMQHRATWERVVSGTKVAFDLAGSTGSPSRAGSGPRRSLLHRRNRRDAPLLRVRPLKPWSAVLVESGNARIPYRLSNRRTRDALRRKAAHPTMCSAACGRRQTKTRRLSRSRCGNRSRNIP